MARKSHRKDGRRARRGAIIERCQWLAPIAARTAAALLLMVVARVLHLPACEG